MTSTSNSSLSRIVGVAVPVPMRQVFDFIVPSECETPEIGARVAVNFGARKLIGVVVTKQSDSSYPIDKLKPINEVLDSEPLFDQHLWATLRWLSAYYLAPIGEVLESALPTKLRGGGQISPQQKVIWSISEFGRSAEIDALEKAPLQLALIKRFIKEGSLGSSEFKQDTSSWRQAIKALVEKGWLQERLELERLRPAKNQQEAPPIIDYTEQQKAVLNQFAESDYLKGFACHLLHGVTGSGKTEVYFALMQQVLTMGKQVLLLVPEIGLTPQLLSRMRCNFGFSVCVMHSGLNDTERHQSWWYARSGEAKIVVGTRSAIFSSFKNLGLIVIDEEHDGSLKQQDGVRYHARDVAIYRAKQLNIPIILGSATPSLESLRNAQLGRYQLLSLTERATKVALPNIQVIDTTIMPLYDGLSPTLIEAISHALNNGKQVMVYINRRGFAPVLYCSSCKTGAVCHRCDANLTLHKRSNRVRCHHCGFEGRIPQKCGECGEPDLVEIGEGTQRVEDALAQRFAQARVLRIDRDSSQRKGELEAMLDEVKRGDVDILVGTQLLTKGHDFPNVGLVGILGVDHGLYSTDFRSTEMLFQQVLQVAGRAGRRKDVGNVYLQTAFAQHPFFDYACRHDFNGYAKVLLDEREAAAFPPFGYLALIRAESPHQAKALQFLRSAKSSLGQTDQVRVMDAIPAPMERRAGRFRAQLLVSANDRSALNGVLSAWLETLRSDAGSRKLAASVRWSLDVDPIDNY